jgi:hypothetical protein
MEIQSAGRDAATLARRVFLRYALSKDPKVVEKSLGKLEGLLKATGKGENYHAYAESVDAFRDVLYFIEKKLGESAAHKLKAEAPILELMSENPFIPANVLEKAGEDAFTDAIEEVKDIRAICEEAFKPKTAGNEVAMEFNTPEALHKYLQEHPGADKSLHSVKQLESESDADLDYSMEPPDTGYEGMVPFNQEPLDPKTHQHYIVAGQPKFNDQRKMLLDGLKAKGWDVKDSLGTPHATTRDHGGTRLWFKSQAVYMNDLGTDPRNFKNTHSLSSDIREYKDVDALLQDVDSMRKIQEKP